MKRLVSTVSTLAALAAAVTSLSAHGALSTFDAGTQGWSATGDAAGDLQWSAVGGNPGGHVFIDDRTTGGVTYFVAPDMYLGNKSFAAGTMLTFDLRQVYPGGANQFNDEDVILQGAGLTLAYDLATNPANGGWTSYAVPLSAGAWHIDTLNGAVASEAQLAAVLSNLTGLRIRAEYQSGADVGSLDNVSMVPEPSALAMLLSGGALVHWLGRRRRTGVHQ